MTATAGSGGCTPYRRRTTADHGQAGGLPLHSTRHTSVPLLLDPKARPRALLDTAHSTLRPQALPLHHTRPRPTRPAHALSLRSPGTRPTMSHHHLHGAHRAMLVHGQTVTATAGISLPTVPAGSLQWTVNPRCTLALRFLGFVNPVFACQAKVQTDRLDNDNLRS